MKTEKTKTEKQAIIRKDTVAEEDLIRILSTDIPVNKKVYAGLTRIKGISWSFSNAICRLLKIERSKKIKDLSEQDIDKISSFIKTIKLPDFLMNQRKDFETGKSSHLISSDLDLKKEFDIKRMRKIKSYRGVRHILGQPVRGQRTKSHFRQNKSVGVIGKGGKKSGTT